MADGRAPHDRSSEPEGDRSACPQFDSLVAQLADDPRWCRRVGRVHLRHRCATALGWMLRGFGELGCWFTAVPAPGTAARAAVIVPPGRGN